MKRLLWLSGSVGAFLILWLACGPAGRTISDPPAVQLHLHGPASEDTGSLRAGNRRAREANVDVLFWTDHDFRVSYWSFVQGYDFEGVTSDLVQRLPAPNPTPKNPTFEYTLTPRNDNGTLEQVTALLTDQRAREGRRSFQISARADQAEYQSLYYEFNVTRMRDHRALAAEVRITFSVYPEISGGVLPAVRVLLSQHFEEYRQQELRYVLWNGAAADLPVKPEAHTAYVPLAYTPGQWNDYDLNLSEDAGTYGRGGRDNSMRRVLFGMEIQKGEGTVYFDNYRIHHQFEGKELQDRILALAHRYGGEFGVVNHIGQEISYGNHVNTWGDWVPMVDYQRQAPDGMDYAQAVEYVHGHRSLISINHYVSAQRYQNDPAALESYFTNTIRKLTEARCWGADLFEHQAGNDGFKLASYLRVWDGLSGNGIYITGNGTSDAHESGPEGWLTGGNLVTWVLSPTTEVPDLLDALGRGAAFFGDPVLFTGTVDFRTAGGHTMGQVVETDDAEHMIDLHLTRLPVGCTIHVVTDAGVIKKQIAETPDVTLSVAVPTAQRTFVRAEVWTAEGRGILVTNPIYFVPRGETAGVPANRLVAE